MHLEPAFKTVSDVRKKKKMQRGGETLTSAPPNISWEVQTEQKSEQNPQFECYASQVND